MIGREGDLVGFAVEFIAGAVRDCLIIWMAMKASSPEARPFK